MISLERFWKITQIHEIHPLGAELLHADRQTDMTNLIVAFRKFANAPKNVAMSVWFTGVANSKNRSDVSHFSPLSDQIFQQ